MVQSYTVELTVFLFGVLVTIIQALGLFILSDIRSRLKRLEDRAMGVHPE